MKWWAALALVWVGCTQPIAPHFAETASVLARGRLSVTAAGGGYGDGVPYKSGFTGAAGSLRVREGVGARQELGVEAYVALYSFSTQYVWGAKLAWKGAPTRWLALLAGIAALSNNGSPGFGYDLGLVLSPAPARWRAQPYLGLRAALTDSLDSRMVQGDELGPSVALIVAAGCEVRLTRLVSVFFEGAPFWHWDWSRHTYLAPGGPTLGGWQVGDPGARPNGGYGALALAFHI